MIHTNIVPKAKLRKVQSETLNILKDALICSFGPVGSNTGSKKMDAFTKYTKDGFSILKLINFQGPIEFAVKEDLEELTRHIVKNVGDGTTSAIILSALIFDEMVKLETSMTPFQIIKTFKNCVEVVSNEILKHKKETSLEDIYNIAFIATNGNEEIAGNMKKIYEQYGMDVFIDVNISTTTENLIKEYDGMTINSGYSDSCYINNKNGSAAIRNAHVYVFEHPIDTPEQAGFLDAIVAKNIFSAKTYNDIIPTVVMAPKVSNDMAAYLGSLCEQLAKSPIETRPPFLLITNIHETDQFLDIAKLCGAKTIKKYIDPNLQKIDIEKGLAPTPETIVDFCGFCELVEATSAKTKFVNPECMTNKETGERSDLFNGMLQFLEAELEKAYEEKQDDNFIGTLKRRINSLKANMVEYLVGGVSVSDRDSLRDLVEDAVLNCRSAAQNGFGYGANFEGLRASVDVLDTLKDNEKVIGEIIATAYTKLTQILYETAMDKELAKEIISKSLEHKQPMNIRTGNFDGQVVSSIKSDIVILETISKIVTLMVTCNQFLCPTPAHNTYVAEDEITEEDDKYQYNDEIDYVELKDEETFWSKLKRLFSFN